jgi:hypothetical protein
MSNTRFVGRVPVFRTGFCFWCTGEASKANGLCEMHAGLFGLDTRIWDAIEREIVSAIIKDGDKHQLCSHPVHCCIDNECRHQL